MADERPLPEPDSEELFSLLGQSALRVLYGWVYRRRDGFMTDALDEPQEHTDRRLRATALLRCTGRTLAAGYASLPAPGLGS